MVEIIPKPIEKIPFRRRILSNFSIIFLIGVVIVYFILVSLQKKSEIRLQDIEKALAQTKSPQVLSLEKEILSYQQKIKKFFPLLQAHVLTSKTFEFLEKNTHPKVFFSKINLNSKDSTVILFGQTDSFFTLGQQLLIFEKESLVENLNLSEVSIGKEGRAWFILNLSLNPKIFQY
jgi:hypothetical protein